MKRLRHPTRGQGTQKRLAVRPVVEQLEDRTQPSGFAGLGTAANFGVLALPNTAVNNSNVTITGDVGVSQGGKLTNMAPSTITGNVVEYSAGQYTGPGKLGGNVVVDPALIAQADADALSAASQAAALTPTQTFGTIGTPTTVTGNGGLNVIAVNGDLKASLILSGSSSDVFVVNVTGTATFTGNSVLGLTGGVTADHVLYNFTGASGNITSHVGNVFNGTLLAPHYSFNLDGTFNGEIIGGGKTIALLSGAKVHLIPFVSSVTTGANLSGSVYVDFNDNGVRDQGEPGIAGVTIILTGTDDLGNAVSQTTFTDDSGNYTFANLRPGTYQVFEVQPQDYIDGLDAVGTVNGVQRGQLTDNDTIGNIVLAAGEAGLRYDFGELLAGS
ncbi:MAG TPA: SdrD B-like domain-containing protein [Gemmataceae bacterium]|jgi:hypothetical protein